MAIERLTTDNECLERQLRGTDVEAMSILEKQLLKLKSLTKADRKLLETRKQLRDRLGV